MNIDVNRVATYLAGNFPPYYEQYSKLKFIKILLSEASSIFPQKDEFNFIDQHSSSLQVFFKECLSLIEQEEILCNIIEKLKIPTEAIGKDYIEQKAKQQHSVINLKKIEEYLDGANEEQFSRFIVVPILQAMGFEEIEYKGKVNETDFGIDFYPVKYKSPSGIVHYAGIQTKSKKMTNGDTTPTGKDLNDLIGETKTAFSQAHRTSSGQEVMISEYIVLNSKEVSQGAKEKYFKNHDIKDRKLKFIGKDGILSLISELEFKNEFFTNLETN